jgi:glycosyltransferase involved in cell wall biosynthesis
MPKVSVIMPCFNQGTYIDEAVNSVLGQTFQDFEIVIVNDGSTCAMTNEKIASIRHEKIRCICKNNGGVEAARNDGILNSSGEYILPLDADDKIAPAYLEKAVSILDSKPHIGIVYGDAEFFGAMSGEWILPEFSLERILYENIIYCSALFRRKDFVRTPGYRSEMRHGWEDWDLWLSFLELGLGVERLDEIVFYYRRKEDSVGDIMLQNRKKMESSLNNLVRNHLELYLGSGMNPIALKRREVEVSRKLENITKTEVYRLYRKVMSLFR